MQLLVSYESSLQKCYKSKEPNDVTFIIFCYYGEHSTVLLRFMGEPSDGPYILSLLRHLYLLLRLHYKLGMSTNKDLSFGTDT